MMLCTSSEQVERVVQERMSISQAVYLSVIKHGTPFTLIRSQYEYVWLVGCLMVWNPSFCPYRVNWMILIICWICIKLSKLTFN